MDSENLDFYLRNSLIALRDSPIPNKGVVAAAMIDSGKIIYATSERLQGNIYVHAERNILDLFVENYGLPSKDAVIVSSLSPCIKMVGNRKGIDCSGLLLGNDEGYPNLRIHNIHVGFVDPLQGSKADYVNMGFNLTVTGDQVLADACQRLFGYFSPENYGKVNIQSFVKNMLKDI